MDDDFTRFYRDSYPGAVRLGWLLTHDHDAAEDVVQDAFMRLQPRLASDRAPHRVPADRHRERVPRPSPVSWPRRRRVAANQVGGRGVVDGPAVRAARRGRRLPYKQRAVLVLRYWADLPEEEIAEIVGVRPATVRSITARALAQLRKDLPDDH